MKLVYESGEDVKKGDIVTTSRNQKVEVISWTEPHKPSSTGRVYVKFVGADWKQEFFPNVIKAKFI